jgi:hypothetical protein
MCGEGVEGGGVGDDQSGGGVAAASSLEHNISVIMDLAIVG